MNSTFSLVFESIKGVKRQMIPFFPLDNDRPIDIFLTELVVLKFVRDCCHLGVLLERQNQVKRESYESEMD